LTGPWSSGDHLGFTGEIFVIRAGTPPPAEPNFYPLTPEDDTTYANGGLWPIATTGNSLCRVLPGGLGQLPGSWTALIPNPGRPVNSAPTAVADAIHTPLTQGDLVLAVRTNDTDPDNDVLMITAVGTPANGSANTDGSVISYTPGPGYVGNDSFSYTVIDGFGGTSNGTVQLVNTMPVAVPDTVHAAIVGGVATLDVRPNDTDADGDTPVIISVQTPTYGSATTNGETVTYTPGPGFLGTDQFNYTISDGYGGTATAQVTLVNTQPVVGADTLHAPIVGGEATLDVLPNDTDDDSDALAIVSVQTPANGSASSNGQTITYTPGPGFTGSDQFNYTISDGHGGTATGQIVLGNMQPVAFADSFHLPLTGGDISVEVRTNDLDGDGDGLVITQVGPAANGSTATNGAVVLFSPGSGYNGNTTFSYTIADGYGGKGTGTANLTNSQPTAESDSADTTGDPVTITVLGNDTDADSDSLSLVSVTNGAFGTVEINGSSVVYTPGESYLGEDDFTYTIADGFGGTAVGNVSVRATGVAGRTEAATGAPVPGAPGMTFASLQVPAIGDDGLIAWLSNVKGVGVKSKPLLLGGNPATALFGKGDAVPDLGGAILFTALRTPVTDSAGRVVFSGTFAGPGVTKKNNVALFATQPGGATARIARTGDSVPEALGQTFLKFTAMDASDGETAFVAQLTGKGTGVWAWDGTANSRVLGNGVMLDTPLGPKSVGTISLLGSVPGSPGHPRSHRAGELAMRVGFTDKSSAIAVAQRNGVDWTTSVLALGGQPAGISGTWKSFGPAALAAPGSVALAVTLAGTTPADDRAIVLLSQDDPVQIARESQPGPIMGTTFKALSDPVANSDGLISFTAKIGGLGVTNANDGVLARRDASGTTTVVIREADPVPGLTGVTWRKVVSYALPPGEDAGPIFLAQLSGLGVTKKNNLGLWARGSDGALVLLARTGNSMMVNGSPKTPTKLVLLNALPPVQGSGRSFNETLRVAFLATFTDGTQAIQIVRVP
jgi:hypothetical protein